MPRTSGFILGWCPLCCLIPKQGWLAFSRFGESNVDSSICVQGQGKTLCGASWHGFSQKCDACFYPSSRYPSIFPSVFRLHPQPRDICRSDRATGSMASTTFALEDAIKAIAENGFYHIQDSIVGRRILDMEENKQQFSTTSMAGLQFYRDNVRNNEVNQLQKWLFIHFS